MKMPPWTLVSLSLALGAAAPLFADETTKPSSPPPPAPEATCPYAAQHAQMRERMLGMHQQMLEAKDAQTRNRLMSQQMALMHEAMASMHGGAGAGAGPAGQGMGQGMGPGMMAPGAKGPGMMGGNRGAGMGPGNGPGPQGMGPGMMGPGGSACMAERMAMMEAMMQLMLDRMEPPPAKKK